MLETPEKIRELQRKLYQKPSRNSNRESHWEKMIGKQYMGKPYVQ